MVPLAALMRLVQSSGVFAAAKESSREFEAGRSDRDFLQLHAKLLEATGRRPEAIDICLQLVSSHPHDATLISELGVLYENSGNYEAALELHERAVKVEPTSQRHDLAVRRCQVHLKDFFSGLDALIAAAEGCPDDSVCYENFYAAMHFAKSVGDLPRATQVAKHLQTRFARNTIAELLLPVLALYSEEETGESLDLHHTTSMKTLDPRTPFGRGTYNLNQNPDRDLRVGFISADFRRHSVAHFVQALLSHSSDSRLRVMAYMVGTADDVTPSLVGAADRARIFEVTDVTRICAQIRADKIDVLVDLSGPTSATIVEIMLRSPAPVQISMIGYPHHFGSDRVPYHVSDSIADQSASVGRAMKLRMNRCFLNYVPLEGQPPSPIPLKQAFGSLNNPLKLEPSVLAAWSQILGQCPHASLILKGASYFGESYRRAGAKRLHESFARLGVDPERIIVQDYTRDHAEPFETYREISVALDPFPYNGTTTTLEALAAGVPVVTLEGHDHRSRVGVSVLSHLGKSEWVTPNIEGYVQTAVRLMEDTQTLSQIREDLPSQLRKSQIMDGASYRAEFENLVRQAWTTWCENSD